MSPPVFSSSELPTGFAGDMEKIYILLNKRIMSIKMLSLVTGLSPKGVSILIHIMRRRGVPIVNIRGKGYYIAKTDKEAQEEVMKFRKIGGGYFKTAKAMINKKYVQLELF